MRPQKGYAIIKNMRKSLRKTRNFFMAFAFLGFFASIFAFGADNSLALGIITGSSNASCLLMSPSHHQICQNDLAEHLSFWQAMFTSLPQEKSSFSLLSIAFSLVLTLIFRERFLLSLGVASSISRLRLKQYHQFTLFNFLRRLFSQGILHPKSYSFVAV